MKKFNWSDIAIIVHELMLLSIEVMFFITLIRLVFTSYVPDMGDLALLVLFVYYQTYNRLSDELKKK